MKYKGRTQAQLILVAGFLVAIAIIGVAVTLSGVFFTQNVEESGLSQFESSATTQQQSADYAAHQSLILSNNLSERRGLNSSNLTMALVNYMRNYTKATQNVSQLQAVINVSLNQTSLNKSWLAGRKKPGVLPGWSLTNQTTVNRTVNRTVGRSPFDIAYTLDTSGSMADPANTTDWRPNGSYLEDPSAYLEPDGDISCSPPSTWDDCDVRRVQGEDPPAENQGDVDNHTDGDIVQYDESWYNNEWAEVIGGPNSGQYLIRVLSTNNTYWVNEWEIEDWDIQYKYIDTNTGTKLEVAQEAAKKAVGAMNSSDRAELVEYNSGQDLEYALNNMTSSNKNNINSSIDGLSSGGGTNIPVGLRQSVTDLISEGTNTENDSDFIVLLSDGLNTMGPDGYDGFEGCNYHPNPGHTSYHDVNPGHPQWGSSTEDSYAGQPAESDSIACDETLEQADRAAANNITIYTIAFGSGADIELMKEVASRTGGNYSFATSDDLVNILQQIIDDIQDDLPTRTNTTTISEPVLSEPIQKIYQLQLNVTSFNRTENVTMKLTNTTQNASGFNVTEDIWSLKVNNTGSSYTLNLTTYQNSEQTTINENISDNSTWIRFNVFQNEVIKQDGPVTSFNLHPQDIRNKLPLSFSMQNPNKSARGTFRFEFEPTGGTLNGSTITGLCSGSTTCGYQSNTNTTYSTTKIRRASVSVRYDSASGDYEREIEVKAD